MKIPPDLENPSPTPNTAADPAASAEANPLGPNPSAAGLDASASFTGQKSSKTPMIVVGVLVLGRIGYFVYASMQKQADRKLQASFMEAFQSVEKEDVGKFWQCVLGEKADGSQIRDNLTLGRMVEGAYMRDPKGYPAHM